MTLEAPDLTVMRLPSTAAEPTDLAALARASGTTFILAVFTNLAGKPCAKLVPVEAVEELQNDGVGFAGYAAGSMGQVPKDPDLVAVPPDASSFTRSPPSSVRDWRSCTATRTSRANPGRTRRA